MANTGRITALVSELTSAPQHRGSTRPRRGDEMSVMPEWFQEQEQEEREAERRANLDEWRRIAKMLRGLEYIKVPVK